MKTASSSIMMVLLTFAEATGADGGGLRQLNLPDIARNLEYFATAEKSEYTTSCAETLERPKCSDDYDSYGTASLIVNFVDVKAPDLKENCESLAKLEDTLLEFLQSYVAVEARKIACVVVDQVYPTKHDVAVRLQLTIEVRDDDRTRRDLQTCTQEDQMLCCAYDAIEGGDSFCREIGCDGDLCETNNSRNLRRHETSSCSYVEQQGLASLMSCDGIDHATSQPTLTVGGHVSGDIDPFLSTTATLAVMTTDNIYVGCECIMAEVDEDCDVYDLLGCDNMGEDLRASRQFC